MAFVPSSSVYPVMTKKTTAPVNLLTHIQFLGLFPYKRLSSGEYQVSFPLLSWSFIFTFLMFCTSGYLFNLSTSQSYAFLLSLHISHLSIVVISFAFFLHAFQWRKHGVIFSRLEALLTNSHLTETDRSCWKITDFTNMKFILLCVAQAWQMGEAALSVASGEADSFGEFPIMIFYSLHFVRQCSFTLLIQRIFRVLASPLEVMDLSDPWPLLDSSVYISSILLQNLHTRVVKVMLC